MNYFHSTDQSINHLLRSFGSNTPPLGAKIEFSFAKLFSKASKIPRLLAAGIFFIDPSIIRDNFDRGTIGDLP